MNLGKRLIGRLEAERELARQTRMSFVASGPVSPYGARAESEAVCVEAVADKIAGRCLSIERLDVTVRRGHEPSTGADMADRIKDCASTPYGPLAVFERDVRGGFAALRSEIVDRRFFEVECDGSGRIRLRHYAVDENRRRELEPFEITRREFESLVGGIAAGSVARPEPVL